MENKIEGLPAKLNEDGFFYVTRELTDLDLLKLGPEISTKNEDGEFVKVPLVSHDVCKELDFVALEEFYFVNKDGTKVIRFQENETFPIFAFIRKNPEGKEWLKVYMPNGKKSLQEDGTDWRFRYLGKKETPYIFGLDKIREVYNKGVEEGIDKYEEAINNIGGMDKFVKLTAEKQKEIEKLKNFKLERICIASGGTDGMNLRALGEFPIWDNSEKAHFPKKIIEELKKMAYNVVNIPDCDNTGFYNGKIFALEHLEFKTLWLNDYINRKSKTDFKDYVSIIARSLSKSDLIQKVKDILDAAKPAQFWETYYSEKSGKISYGFHHIFGFYFLKLNGFVRVDDVTHPDGFYFARIINGYIVEVLKNTQGIKDHFKNFLLQRQKEVGIRKIPYELINSLISSPRLSDNNLAGMDNLTLDFSDKTQFSQHYYFSDRIWKVTAKGTEEVFTPENYVLKSKLLDERILEEKGYELNLKKIKLDENQFKKDEAGNFLRDQNENLIPEKKPYFDIQQLSENDYDIDIKEKDCDFLNFLIQTSRIYWEKEKSAYAAQGYSEEDFYEKSKFDIAGERLTDEEIHIQKAHLINKIYTIGYLLHNFKENSKPLIPYAVDNNVTEEKTASGGSGKGTFFSAFDFLKNKELINGKQKFEADNHVFENVDAHTGIILFDDIEQHFDFKFLYSISTDGITINPKGTKRIKIKYKDSPKICVSSNYSIKNMTDGSSVRRMLLIAFSDYYHAVSPDREERTPRQDFGYDLFTNWESEQWNKFFNFMVQCLSFYLRSNKVIQAPQTDILKRTWLSQMGENFKEWADNFYNNNTDVVFRKIDVMEDFKEFAKKNNYKFSMGIGSNEFKKKTKAWCNYNHHELEEDSGNFYIEEGTDILHFAGSLKPKKRKTYETIKITKKSEAPSEPTTETENQEINLDDIM